METASEEFCAANSYVNVTLPTGYIVAGGSGSSRVSTPTERPPFAPASSCDHSVKPWVIAARRGQRVNLTLYDFALAAGASVASSSSSSSAAVGHLPTSAGGGGGGGRICRQYGWLDDSAFDRPSPLCAADRRVGVVYTSRGHVVKLWTMTSSTASASAGHLDVAAATGKRFMIKYAGAWCTSAVDRCRQSIPCGRRRGAAPLSLSVYRLVHGLRRLQATLGSKQQIKHDQY